MRLKGTMSALHPMWQVPRSTGRSAASLRRAAYPTSVHPPRRQLNNMSASPQHDIHATCIRHLRPHSSSSREVRCLRSTTDHFNALRIGFAFASPDFETMTRKMIQVTSEKSAAHGV